MNRQVFLDFRLQCVSIYVTIPIENIVMFAARKRYVF